MQGTELFEDLSKGEYFLPACLQVERILDVDDAAVNIATIDWRTRQLPPMPPPSPLMVSYLVDLIMFLNEQFEPSFCWC
jgi:hypothetical protein